MRKKQQKASAAEASNVYDWRARKKRPINHDMKLNLMIMMAPALNCDRFFIICAAKHFSVVDFQFCLFQILNCTVKGGECDETKGRVVCGTDNQTYATRCHLIRAQCAGHKVQLKHRGPCKGENQINKIKSRSERTRTHAPTKRINSSHSIYCSLVN